MPSLSIYFSVHLGIKESFRIGLRNIKDKKQVFFLHFIYNCKIFISKGSCFLENLNFKTDSPQIQFLDL